MANVFKDIGQIWTRLFDHRPFLSGEIKHFVREFEEKRSDREVEGLFQVLETATEVKDSQIDRLKLAGDAYLLPLVLNTETAVGKCEAVLDRESLFREDCTVENRRAFRKVEWESFIEDITVKCGKVDETFKQKEDDLKDFYTDLERKLHISPVHSAV